MPKRSKNKPTWTPHESKARPLGPDAQLCDRLQAAEILGISYGSVRVLEKKKKLIGRRLIENKHSRVMFAVTDVLKLAKINEAVRALPTLGSIIIVNGRTYKEVPEDASA